ncbi:MAG: HNH endonuclease [Actinobacteria bacterium]|uniref:HNH endonuclease n=1 Tax=Candidatus Fonsibacter lacus TaxID=2576439 RepID=A0A965GBD2_9PROT|nr:HNH endonuclease [Candidatus Fonsibacter lacus]
MNSLDQRVSEIKIARPSAQNLLELTSLARYELTPDGRVELLTALERHLSWLTSHINEVTYLISLDQPGALSGGAFEGYGANGSAITSELNDQEREEIAAALRISPNTAQHRIDTANLLVHHLPDTTRALAEGVISTAHANVIARESAPLIYGGADKAVIAKIEAKALASAEFSTPNQIAVAIRKAVAQASPQELEERFKSAREERKVICYPERDGMSTISALLTAPDARLIMRSLEKRISEVKDLSKSADQRRADTFVELLTRADIGINHAARLGSSSMGSSITNSSISGSSTTSSSISGSSTTSSSTSGNGAQTNTPQSDASTSSEKTLPKKSAMTINVIVDLPTLLGLADNPAELSGYGAIPASLARELATSNQWRRFVTDPISGELLECGRERYQPPDALVDFINARDKTCRFPGCRRSAELSDIDHAIPWDKGGETNPENLGALCRRHHRLKTHGGWKISSNADGSCTWTSPFGREYFLPARPIHEVA